ncbi:PTS sugar transporter subunit IIA [Pisciglobus halotolerans]|uniref:PTS system IIA component, Fru family n=1 Tax=Pisciglobus halotolerans TaxID=745365 RepID=A0A1I3AZ07_9LACT|nr:PTS sugar transporter subunit IIA [Pisciglobus halotolerans]SFH55264.1 PTS system IIA component, Fru family [Pisciglobus halotolerans]
MSEIKIKKENIILNLEANNKQEVILELASRLEKNGYILNLEEFVHQVINREEQISTGIGKNIAIPHGKSSFVKESTICAAKLNKPIKWSSMDGEPVEIVFLLAIKGSDEGDKHLRILADLAEKLMDDLYVKKIKATNDFEQFYSALQF